MRAGKFLIYLLSMLSIITGLNAQVLSPWGDYPKRIVGRPLPLSNVPPYTPMSNIGNGVWVYSNYFNVGAELYVKFAVLTNTNSTYLQELIKPFNITLPWGWNDKVYYITNKDNSGEAINIARVTEGTTNNMFVQIEFNWEGDPDPPTGIIGEAYSEKAVIKWTASVELDVIGYNVYMSNSSTNNYFRVNTSIITGTSFTVTNLINGTTNYFYVTAVDAYTNMPNNESPPSSVVSVIPGKEIYVLFYCKMDREKVQESLYIAGEPSPLNWNGAKMEYLYNNIWYYKNRFNEFTTIKYKYKYYTNSVEVWERDFDSADGMNRVVTLIDDDGDGVIVLNDIWNMYNIINPAPSPPTNIIAVPGNSNVYLFWQPNKEIDIKSYRIYRSNSNTNEFVLIDEVAATNYNDTTVINYTNYFYRLTAVDLKGNESDFSKIVSATPSTNPAPITPYGLTAVAGDGYIILNWATNPENDIKGYVIYRSNSSSSSFSNFPALITDTTYTDTNVVNGTTYYYKLRAVDTIDQTNTGFSIMVSATPSTDPAPIAPAGLELLLAGNKFLIISWDANPESDIEGYRVYYGTNTLTSSNFTSITVCTLTGLTNGKRYEIRVKAIDIANQISAYSAPLYAYPVPVIMDLTARPSGQETGAVLLSWTAPDVAGSLGPAVRYIIKYSTNKINNLNEFRDATTFCDTYANYAGMIESISVNNLGTGCPGYYFTIAAVYGDDLALGLSDSIYSVAAELVPVYRGGTYRKIGEKLRVEIPADVLPAESTAIVIKNRIDLIKEEADSKIKLIQDAFSKAQNYPSIRVVSTDLYYEIYIINSGSEIVNTVNRMRGEVRVYLPFSDMNHNGIVDETEGNYNIRVDNLRLFQLNETTYEWGFVQRSIVNKVDNLVSGYVKHFSVFTIMANLPAIDLENVVVYPNPAYKPSDKNKIRFKHLTTDAKIRIYNIAGELVRQGLRSDSQGICEWNGDNDFSQPVASGIYIYYIEDGKNKPVKGKIAIIR